MLDPKPRKPASKRTLSEDYGTGTYYHPVVGIPGEGISQPDADNPIHSGGVDPQSQYYRHFRGDSTDTSDPNKPRFDFHLQEPEGQELEVLESYIKCIRFGTGQIIDYDKRGLLPGLFLETGTDSFSYDFPGIEQSKDGEVMPIVLRLWTREPDVKSRTDVAYRYRDSNPIFIAQFKEQLDYFLDRNEFIGITMPRIGYSLPSSVQDCRVRLSQTLQGIRAPYEAIDFRFEVTFSKQKEIDDRYAT